MIILVFIHRVQDGSFVSQDLKDSKLKKGSCNSFLSRNAVFLCYIDSQREVCGSWRSSELPGLFFT